LVTCIARHRLVIERVYFHREPASGE
jgi:hypothetical protein